ncbi:hypothetical protein [Pelotomaculum propionicicum]|nr:hypothetical protein [Pelotomaculum propionicicum]
MTAQPAPAGARQFPAGSKESLLQAVEQELAAFPQLVVERSSKTDLEIKSVLADAHWGVGKKKVEYSACLLAKETERKVVFWEMIKETGAGMGVFGGFKVEKYKSDGSTRSGTVREAGYGPGGKIIDYNWDYAQTRSIVEGVVRAGGWKFTTSLLKGKATY